MKTYTLEQIKKYIISQDSLGDVLYNLQNIDKYLINDDIEEIKNADDLNDYLLDMEDNQGCKFSYNGDLYKISNDVTDFIRNYTWDNLSQIITRKDALIDLIEQGLIEEIIE